MPLKDGHSQKAEAQHKQFEHLKAKPQEPVADSKIPVETQAADAMGKAAGLSENHQVLLKLAGHWVTSCKSWNAEGEPTVTPGTMDAKLVLDGHFLEQTFSSTMMAKPIAGIGMLGYDVEKKKFVATWLDSVSTGINRGEGSLDASGKVLTMKWTSSKTSAGRPSATMVIQRLESDTRRVSEFYEKGADGKNKKFLEIVYTK